jgi:hypothetical protein
VVGLAAVIGLMDRGKEVGVELIRYPSPIVLHLFTCHVAVDMTSYSYLLLPFSRSPSVGSRPSSLGF